MKKVDTSVKTNKKKPIKAISQPTTSSKKVKIAKKTVKHTPGAEKPHKKSSSSKKPKENKKPAKNGRPTKYNKKLCQSIIDFFNVPKSEKFIKSERTITKSNGTTEHFVEYGYRSNDLPTYAKFARFIGVNKDTIVEWAKAENSKKYPGFSVAYNAAKELQKEFLSDNALKGYSPPASFIFVAKNITDWKDKQEVDTKHSGEVLMVKEIIYK